MAEWVRGWLEGIGLGQYAAAFAENAVSEDILPQLSDTDLRELGVAALGHRKRIAKAIAALAEDGARSPAGDHREAGAVFVETPPGHAAWERRPGDRRPVTMLFADVTGSTGLTEKLDPEEAHELLYGAVQRICAAVESNRGTVCRFMGDGVMAMFGAPVASERHALDACQAALEMQQATRDRADGLQIRVGLHSGEVVVLEVGAAEKVEYDASGPTVPIAARMEQAAKPGEVYLTGATVSLAADGIDIEALPPLTVKGVSEPLTVFVLRRVKAHDEITTPLARTAFVGRRAEIRQLRAMLGACSEDARGQTVHVRGEPGVGKTRLVEEFTRTAAQGGVSLYRGLLLPFGVGKGQDAIRSIVRSLLGIPPGSGKSARQRAADAMLDDVRLSSEQAVFLYDLLDLQLSTEQRTLFDAMDEEARNRGKREVVSRLVAIAAGLNPTCIVIEDVHWADPVALAYLAALTTTVAECPALLLMTSRIDADPIDQSWRANISGSPLFTIDLGPLRRQESIEFISGFIDIEGPLAQKCLDRAAGNPLFLEQLLRTARTESPERLPDSIQSLVLARLDRLGVQDKRALQAASVIGQRFDMGALRHLLGIGNYDCRELAEHNLVRPDGQSYLFAHALIQEGVYGSLLAAHRRELHTKAAQWFADSDRRLCAQHLDRAGDEGAPRAYLNAAREQVLRYRDETAIDLCERGLSLVRAQSDRHALSCLMARLLLDRGQVESCMAVLRQAEECADTDEKLCDVWMGMASCLRVTADYDAALRLLERSEPIAVNLHHTLQLSRLHHLRGNLLFPLGKVASCHEQHQRALDFAREAGSLEDEARALGGLGDAQYARGRMRSASASLRLCVEKCRAIGLGRVEVANLSQMSNCQPFLVDGERAFRDLMTAAQAASRVSHSRAEMVALSGAFGVTIELGDLGQAQEILERGKVLTRELKARVFETMWQGCTAQLSYSLGYQERALGEVEAAIQNESVRSFLGAWLFGLLAMMSEIPARRARALEAGEQLLQQGTIGESVLHFYRYAMDASVKSGDWGNVEKYATALQDYTSAEPLPWSEFFVARGRLLAAHGRGERGHATTDGLQRLLREAEQLGLRLAMPALEQALNLA